MKKIAVFVSGGGSNMQAIIDSQKQYLEKFGRSCPCNIKQSKCFRIRKS